MLIAIAYCRKDREQADALSGWLHELGPFNHDLLTVRDYRTKPVEFTGFRSQKEIIVRDPVDTWPAGPNASFSAAGKYIEYKAKQPWLWLEPDAIPLRKEWIDLIEQEYLASGKPFMGARVEVPNVPVHMSGVGVYPARLSHHAGLAYQTVETAWDVTAAQQIVPQAHFTNLIQHQWKAPSFESWADVEKRIRPEAVIFHANKDGSLIQLLREHNLPASEFLSPAPVGTTNGEIKCKEAPLMLIGEVASAPRIFTLPNLDDVPKGRLVLEGAIDDAQDLASRLKTLCRSNAKTRRIRRILHEAGVIQLPYLFRKRKGWKRKRSGAKNRQ